MTNKSTTRTTSKQSTAPVSSGLAVTSLVLGVVSFTGFGLITGIPAIILGIIALNKKQGERSMSIAGIVMGAISTFFSLLFILFVIIMFIIAVPHESAPYEDSPGINEDWFKSSEV
ncbi:MAG TPA: DUF4190 domain-containing protein [Candidatus Saccharimonadales bacterium]|nr:DUF4190 domain-containing protein [Candidatus Saccharimonadales bacterium]